MGISCCWAELLSTNDTSGHLSCDVIWCIEFYFLDMELSTGKQNNNDNNNNKFFIYRGLHS